VDGNKLHNDVLHDLYSSFLKKLRRKKWAGLVARLVQLCCILNSSGKLNGRDREWKFVRQWWDRIKVIALSMGYGEAECMYLVNSRILCRLQ
jgi:hypothetical protein